MPDSSKTWLKLVKGTLVVTHQDRFSAQHPPTADAPGTPSDAPLLIPKSLLDDLPAERKIAVAADGHNKARNWYRLDGLLHDASHTLLDGWVCDEVGVTPWVSPWSWEGHAVLLNFETPRRMLASFKRARGEFDEAQRARFPDFR